jgi:Lamin Tail Domain
MAEPTGLKIVRIHNAKTGAKDENEEWILINNDGHQSWKLAGWMVTDQTATQQHVHIYRFPATTGGNDWSFDPGESIFIFTGVGTDVFIAKPANNGRPQFHLHMNRRAMVWNNTGDRVYLRNQDGTFATQPYPVP